MKRKYYSVLLLFFLGITTKGFAQPKTYYREVVDLLKNRVLIDSELALKEEPLTVTAEFCERSAGNKHDFFSESDYFWPNPENPEGPYKEIDGKTNPSNFVEHRKLMIRFSKIIGVLASAYKITGDDKYVKHAIKHLNAWFVDENTRMSPHLKYAQAIRNGVTGRNYGIIDTIHFLEVVQGMMVMEKSKFFDEKLADKIKKWFSQYNLWLTTSEMGLKEKEIKNNHSTCWLMQVASFAKLTGNQLLLDSCTKRFKEVLLPNQMAENGSFPLELRRTKPYGYAIFNLDAMATVCQILSTPKDNLWKYQTNDGKSLAKGISFLYPYIADKSSWTYPEDIMFYEFWPVAQPFLLFGAFAYKNRSYFDLWKKLERYPTNEEVIRNLPVRNPIIWLQ
ncbi:hypothetical protein Pedsa_1497 [Pseudopedobacter saltans DSM 12145]|uniref:Alginate lyase domain-containing protein n=1 Tax=Pseudopedobacter saltans (strain ATCC 51119 / DSM 12145 / JCM 21818 / CCUG 39354 / LMG 10337 / NBRC 100064 / NCIMB 13643) TaxID=762903 RepID=F0S5B3_PSESL|nr:alginate lyase family protein [Pseudopedobacter saltans]ADY52058.1 hypothetical protein Pedsa_1497 [Pseudopedobacter saltans DSM 12145]